MRRAFLMADDDKLLGQISILRTLAGWQVVTHIGFFRNEAEAEAYAVEFLEEQGGERFPTERTYH